MAPAPGSGSVMIGLDDHLFDTLPSLTDQAAGRLTLSADQVERWVSLIETRHAWCRQHGARYYAVITPFKYVVYADKLPPGVAVSEDRPIRRLLAALTPEVRSAVLYPADVLGEARRDGETYFRTDMHWTDLAGYLVCQRLCERMQTDGAIPPNTPAIALERSTYRRVGDLGMRISPERAEMAARLAPANTQAIRRIFANVTYNIGQVEVLERRDQTGVRGVMFRDSHGSFMLPFLAGDFRRLVAVASEGVFYDLLRSERPDVVITQFGEHALCEPDPALAGHARFPDDFPPVGFAAFSGVALPLVSNAAATDDTASIIDLDFTDRPVPVWSVGEYTEMVLKCRVPHAPCELALTVSPFLHPSRLSQQRLDIVVNGTLVGSFAVTGDEATLTCQLPPECLFSGRTLRLELFHPDCLSPQALGVGTDEREIGLQFRRLVIRSAT